MKIRLSIFFFLILIFIAIFFTKCFKDVCPSKPIYHLFSKDELSYLHINIDSVLSLQQHLSNNEFLIDYYIESDTIDYIDEKSSILSFIEENYEKPGHELCDNEKSMLGVSSCKPLQTCFIKNLTYKIKKTIITNKPAIFTLYVELDDRECSIDYKLNDTSYFKYNFINEPIDTSGSTYFIASIDSITINGVRINNCIKYLFLNKYREEVLKIYYCNKYGFVKITKNKIHEIRKNL